MKSNLLPAMIIGLLISMAAPTRGVDTVDDPYYGTSQHASTEQYHWTDGYGSYRNSNDASYNPNQVEDGNWQLMPMSQ